MPSEEKLIEQIKTLYIKRSNKAIEQARNAVLQEQIKNEPLQEALHYFMEEMWYNAAHPSLISLSCEAVGGNPEETTNISAALVVLTGAADIHDDIIDQSITKDCKPTVFGKYGKDVSIIAGDVLWFKGMLMLTEACEPFPTERRRLILDLIKQAFFDVGGAEAKEASLRRNLEINPDDYLEMIRMKVSIAKASAQIGAIIGNGCTEEIDALGEYGKTVGILMTIRDEFIDMFEVEELKNRFHNECLPLPFLLAFKNVVLKEQILDLLNQKEMNENDLEKLIEKVYEDSKVCELGQFMKSTAKNAILKINNMENRDILSLLLESSLEDLPC